MKTATKPKTAKAATLTAGKKPTAARPDGRPKVKMGTGAGVLFMADTLFDDDLK